MRLVLAKMSAAYCLAAILFGGALLLSSGSGSADEANGSGTSLGWYDLIEMRVNPPPESVTIEIGAQTEPVSSEPGDDTAPSEAPAAVEEPVSEPPAAEPDALRPSEPETVPQEKPKTRVITRYAYAPPEPRVIALPPSSPSFDIDVAELDTFIQLAPPDPQPIPLENREFAFDDALDILRFLGPVHIAPEMDKLSPIAQVAAHLRQKVSRDLYANFDLFLYVSKSIKGPLAQRMYVFAKTRGTDDLTLLHDWPVSTGRESMERDNNGVLTSTATPVGYYQLDPKRFYRRYTSSQWGKPMPNSMFFDWMVRGYQTGLAIHGVSDMEEVAALGSRASGGCVHLSPEASEDLFNLILREYRGMVPRFAYDRDTKTVSNTGRLARDERGALRMFSGYKALVVIENYGGQDLMSELNMDLSGTEG